MRLLLKSSEGLWVAIKKKHEREGWGSTHPCFPTGPCQALKLACAAYLVIGGPVRVWSWGVRGRGTTTLWLLSPRGQSKRSVWTHEHAACLNKEERRGELNLWVLSVLLSQHITTRLIARMYLSGLDDLESRFIIGLLTCAAALSILSCWFSLASRDHSLKNFVETCHILVRRLPGVHTMRQGGVWEIKWCLSVAPG